MHKRTPSTVLAVLAAAILTAAALACGNSTPTPSPTATEQPTNPPTAVPTATHTATPAPTALPPEAQAYLDDVAMLTILYGDSMTAIANLSGQLADAPALLNDAQWRTDIADAIATVRLCNDAIRTLTPTATHDVLHTYLLDAADHFDTAMDYMTSGLDQQNADHLALAAEYITLGNHSVQLATDALRALQQ